MKSKVTVPFFLTSVACPFKGIQNPCWLAESADRVSWIKSSSHCHTWVNWAIPKIQHSSEVLDLIKVRCSLGQLSRPQPMTSANWPLTLSKLVLFHLLQGRISSFIETTMVQLSNMTRLTTAVNSSLTTQHLWVHQLISNCLKSEKKNNCHN